MVLEGIIFSSGNFGELAKDFDGERKMTNRIDLISALEEFVDGINEEPDIVSLAAKSAAKRLFNLFEDDTEFLALSRSTELDDPKSEVWRKKALQIFENEVIDSLSLLLVDSTEMYSRKMANLQEMAADDSFLQVRKSVEQKRRGRPDFINKTRDMTFHFKK